MDTPLVGWGMAGVYTSHLQEAARPWNLSTFDLSLSRPVRHEPHTVADVARYVQTWCRRKGTATPMRTERVSTELCSTELTRQVPVKMSRPYTNFRAG
jgi:hypothetical protein